MHIGVPMVLVSALLMSGCGSFSSSRQNDLMEATLSHYGSALRWGYYESAFSLHDPELPQSPVPDMRKLRLTHYEVIQPPVMEDDLTAVQVVRIEYVRENEQRVQVLSDTQRWRYDPKREAWWLISPFPPFR